ncbi:MAG: non-hydrolyzing UDP-N-acetylglucosamine 2-epimerase [Halobacteriota archaeon]
MKVASIVGARPNFIKLAPVSEELRKRCDEVIIHTGQHYDYEMDALFFDELQIPKPAYHLEVGSGSHGAQTGKMLIGIEAALLREQPDAVLVFGDTNTTFAGAFAAAKMQKTVGHVEAGLRSFNRAMPEEINRVLTDHCSDLLFCPTATAVDNLAAEGIKAGVSLTGDVMVDALHTHTQIAETSSRVLDDLALTPREYYLATIHRPSNTDVERNLKSIIETFAGIANIVFPCHPRTENFLRRYGLWEYALKHLNVIKPAGYFDMIVLEKNARLILTDSGGVQKEAYILKVPCVTLRGETEWVETVEDGWNVLVGNDRDKIMDAVAHFSPPSSQRHVFGRGDASTQIVTALVDHALE